MLRSLRQRGYFAATHTSPDLLKHLDLVALATICDVVPLVGLNRAFVRQGLKVMAQRHYPGLQNLLILLGLVTRQMHMRWGFCLALALMPPGGLVRPIWGYCFLPVMLK